MLSLIQMLSAQAQYLIKTKKNILKSLGNKVQSLYDMLNVIFFKEKSD